MSDGPSLKKYILTLERHPQRDFIKRTGFGFDQTSAVKSILDDYFKEYKKQKVRLASCIEVIDTRP